jgi:DNA-binding PadR family transcriptional regulator
LSAPAFYILLSLAPGRKHGYAILKDVEDLSRSDIVLSTSTLYGALGRLQEQDMIRRISVDDAEKPRPGLPRKFYELSENGRRMLAAETRRMQEFVYQSQQRLSEAGL